MTIRLAVFDCDGTLVDGQHAVCAAMAQGFALAGLPPPPAHEISRMVGLSLPQGIARLAPQADPDQIALVAAGYREAFFKARSEGRVHEPLFAGITELLNGLAARGWRLGVATGKSDRGLGACLATHGLLDRFCTLQTADRHPSKPHPAMLQAALAEAFCAPENSVMIGDTAYDIEMALAAGVRPIGVAWGYHAPEELLAAGADMVAETPAHLAQVIA